MCTVDVQPESCASVVIHDLKSSYRNLCKRPQYFESPSPNDTPLGGETASITSFAATGKIVLGRCDPSACAADRTQCYNIALLDFLLASQ
jgi:hypothetical protein